MRIILIENAFEKNKRQIFNEDYNKDYTVKDYFESITEKYAQKDFKPIVNGETVGWDYKPQKDDEIIFIHNVQDSQTLVMGVLGGALIAFALIPTPFSPYLMIAGISMLGGVLVGYLAKQFFSPDTPDVKNAISNSKTYSFDGFANIMGEGNPVPVVYGRHKVGGCYVTVLNKPNKTWFNWWGWSVNNSEVYRFTADGSTKFICNVKEEDYIYGLIALSEGTIAGNISDVKINKQPVENLGEQGIDYYYEVTNGTNYDNVPANFEIDDIIRNYQIQGVTLDYNNPYTYTTINSDNNKARIIFKINQLFYFDIYGNGSSKYEPNIAIFNIKWRPVGDTYWEKTVEVLFTGNYQSPVKTYFDVTFAQSDKKYEIVITRTTQDGFLLQFQGGDDKAYCNIDLFAIEEIRHADFFYPNTAMLYYWLKANDNVAGGVPEVTCVIDGVKIKDVRTGYTVFSNNPANIIYDILTNTRYGMGLPDNKIDLDSLKEFADWCDEIITYTDSSGNTKTGKRYEFNFVVDTQYQAYELITKIANSARGVPYWKGDKFAVVVDKPSQPIQLFTMGNIVKGSFEQNFTALKDIPNQLTIDFTNEENDYEKEKYVVVDTTRVTEDTNEMSINLFGITRPDIVKREAIFLMNKLKNLRETISFQASIDAVACEVGDVIELQHDLPQYGFGGRILSANANGFYFDRKIDFIDTTSYKVKIKKPDGTIISTIYTPSGNITTDFIDLAYCSEIINAEPNDVYAVGEISKVTKPYRITSITKATDTTVKITAIEYVEEIYDNDDSIVVYNSDYSELSLYELYKLDGTVQAPTPIPIANNELISLRYATPPFVTNISLREDVTLVGSKNVSVLSVEFEPVKMPFGSAIIEKYEILYAKEYQNSGEVGDWVSVGFTTGNKFTIVGLDVGFKYYVVVKPYTNYGITNYPELNGGLNRSFYITLDGIQDTDLIVTNLTYETVENKIILKWDENVKAGFYDIYLGTNYIGRATANTFTYDKLLTEGIYYFHVYVIDKVGNKSNLFESIAVTVNRPNIVSSLNYRIDNYDICLYWDDNVIKTTYDIEYFVLNGIKVRENFYKEKIDWTGIKQYNIYAVDIAGNVSDAYNINVNIIAPNTPSQIICTSKLYGIDIHVDFIEDEYFEALEIFANNLNDRNYAQLIYSGKSHDFYLTNLDLIDSRYFWARTRNKFGVYSNWYPAGVNSGVFGQTNTDPQKLLNALNGSITEDQLISTLNSRIDLIDTANFVVDTNIVESGIIEGGVVGAYPTFFDLTYNHKLRIESLESTTASNLNQISALQSELSALTTSEWDAGIAYTLGRMVRHNGQVYRCILENTNKEPGVAVGWQTYWEESDTLNQIVADVESRVDILEGQIVNKVDITAFNSLSNTVSNHGTLITQNSNNITLKADKTEVSSLSNLLAPEFNANILYLEGDIVRYNGVAYRALVDLFTPAPVPTNHIYWENIGNISNQIKTNYSEIKVNADNISLLSASLTSVDSRLRTTETSITTLAQTDDNLQAQINLKASTTDLNNLSDTVTSLQSEVSINQNNISLVSSAITGTLAVEDGVVENGVLVKSAGDIKDLLGLDLRMSKAFINIDSVEGIVFQHEQALYGTDGAFNKIAQAEQTLQSVIDEVEQTLLAEISQKVAIADYTTDKEVIGTRLTTAETNISTLQTETGNLQSQINNRVTITTYNSDLSGLNTRLTTAETNISTLQTETGNLQSQINNRVTITTYNNDISAVQQTLIAQGNDIGDLKAEYFVKTGVNGYVAGFGLVNDGATSEFAILANKFKVAMPDGSGTPKQVFTVGTINGQTAVGISGDLIIDGSIVATKIATNAITSDKIQANAITTTHISANAITADKITIGAITSDRIATNAITSDKIQANAITTTHISANAITADKLNVTELSSITANLGSITAGRIGVFSTSNPSGMSEIVTTTSAGITTNNGYGGWSTIAIRPDHDITVGYIFSSNLENSQSLILFDCGIQAVQKYPITITKLKTLSISAPTLVFAKDTDGTNKLFFCAGGYYYRINLTQV